MSNLIIFILNIILQDLMFTYIISAFNTLFSFTRQNKQKIIMVFLLNLLIIFISEFFKQSFKIINIILMLISIFMSFFWIFKNNFRKSTFNTIIVATYLAITELITIFIGTIIFRSNAVTISNSNIKILILLNIQTIISISFYYFIKIFLNKKINILKELNKINYKELFLFMSIFLLYIFPQMFALVFTDYFYPRSFLLLNTIQFILIFIFLSIYLKKSIEYEKAQSDLYTSELHNKTLIGMVDGVRTIKHDYNNIIQALSGYIATKQYDKLQEHVNGVLKECNIVNSLSAIDPKIFNEPAIYGIVGAKYFLANNQEITFDFDILTDISKINFAMPDLSRILGILLDNAIEATKKSNAPYLRLEMKFDKRKNSDIIRVINSIEKNTKIDVKSIYNKGFSTKKIKSGIGLWEVKKIINKNKQSQIFANIENDKFIQNIIIEKNE